jgi:hypothetical protein
VKNIIWSLVAVAALGVAGTTPAYAASGGTSIICKILPFLCPPSPVGGGGGKPSVPEPATLAVLGAGVAASLAARRRRNKK